MAANQAAKFASAIIASLLAGPPITIITSSFAHAAGDCQTEPGSETRQGQHWYYHIERGTGRHCWYLREGDGSAEQATPSEGTAAVLQRSETSVRGSIADAYDELEPAQRAGFEEYFVVRTPATARRYRDRVVPGTTLADEAALHRIFAGWTVDVGSSAFSAPTLVVAGRRDSVVGYADAAELLERYPHATLAVIEDAGHAVMHERPELLAALFGDWLDRARPEDK